ncbi:carboxymuconolactone decarboxylase family protein [Erwinia persicina]|uniref:carboxymuconolactone decarboxylase family protein n=1 Tax=Erwinia persicina TaxID=55211 RepID=UPI000788649A|nr:carboxymuconolactone decarboxylase family protein [Erwinia persicina]
MSRIILSSVDRLTAAEREQYTRFPANLTLGLLRTTSSVGGYLSLGASFPAGKLEDKDREMVIMRVGALSHSPYERMQHYPLALKAGWSEEEIHNIERGVVNGHRNSAILSFVEECVNQVKVSASTFRHVAEFYDDTQLAELTLLIGHYMMTARFLETLEIDPDEKATPWDGLSV